MLRDGHEAAVDEALGYLEREACSCAPREGRRACRSPGRGVRRRRVPSPHLARRRPAAAHPRRRRQLTLRARRPLDRARRPAALPPRQDRRLPLPGRAARGAHRAPRARLGAGRATAPPTSAASRARSIEHFSHAPRTRSSSDGAPRRALRSRRASRRAGDPQAARTTTSRCRPARAVADGASARRLEHGPVDDARGALAQTRGASRSREVEVRDVLVGEHGLTATPPPPSTAATSLQALAEAHARRRATVVDVLEARADELLAELARRRALDDGRLLDTRAASSSSADCCRARATAATEPAAAGRPRSEVRAPRSSATLSDEQAHVVEQLASATAASRSSARRPAPARPSRSTPRATPGSAAGVQVARLRALGPGRARAARPGRIDTTTIAQLQHALDRGRPTAPEVGADRRRGRHGRHPRPRRARRRGRARRAKLLLVGDDRQLPEIDAGGAFRALARQRTDRRAHRGPPPGATSGTATRSPRCATATLEALGRRLRRARPHRRATDTPRQRARSSSTTGGTRPRTASRR